MYSIYFRFRNELGKIEQKLKNLLSNSIEQMGSVEDSLLCLQLFHHYSQRADLYELMRQMAGNVWDALLTEVHNVRREILAQRPTRCDSSPNIAGPILSAILCSKRLKRLKLVS